MSILKITRAYGNVKRMQQIALTLARHGFSHFIGKLGLLDFVPGFTRMKSAMTGEAEGSANHSAAVRMKMVLQDLGASSIKLGQLLATRTDLIPQDYAVAFASLQDSVEPLGYGEIKNVIEKNLGRPLDEIFLDFEEKAIASGSIGQVHYARLHDGKKVVVKVKRPGTDRLVREDLDLLATIAQLVEDHLPELRSIRPRVVVEEFAKCMERELDFVGEAAFTDKFSKMFEDDPSVKAPEVFWDYVTRDTLVLERIEGIRLSDTEKVKAAGTDMVKLADTVGKVFLRQFLMTGIFHADPHPGNIFVLGDSQIALIDFGQTGRVSDDIRRKLAMMLLALRSGETDMIVDIAADIGAFSENTDIRAFRSELATLVDRYYGVPIERLNIGQVFQEALSTARENGIILPRDFVILCKAFVTIMSVIPKLDPEWRADEAVAVFGKEVVMDLANPKAFIKDAGLYLYRVISLLRQAPEDMRDLVQKARSGHLGFQMELKNLRPILMMAEIAADRLTMGIIVGAITIGSSIVLAAGRDALGRFTMPYLGWDIPLSAIVASVGFVCASMMGLWIAWGIIRKSNL
ncbi:MAG: hypothetical protein JXR97_02135 [Planctomycetes bacterium]|nr:hypothetical protein [Planctomycetota bacterium]